MLRKGLEEVFMKLKTILLSSEDANIALDKLIAKGLAERRGGNSWRLTYGGQTEGIKVWRNLTDTEKMLIFGMLEDLDRINKKGLNHDEHKNNHPGTNDHQEPAGQDRA